MGDIRKPAVVVERINTLSLAEELALAENNKAERTLKDDLSDTLNSVVNLLQSVADQLSLATERSSSGSNVNSLNELSWETAAFEKDIRDRLQWIGEKVSTHRVPRIIGQLFGCGRDYARENPLTAFILLCLCLTSSAPVLVFLVFAVATILVTFLGFLFVEGTLLTGATIIFGGVIVIVGFITLTGVLLGMLGYFTTTQAYLVVTGQSQIFKILRRLPLIGGLFPAQKDHPKQNGVVRNGHSNGHAQRYYVEEADDSDEASC